MPEPSERDMAIWADAHTRYVLDRGGCQPALPYDWSLVGMIAIAAAREEGRREPRPITRKERVPFVVAQEDSSARPITDAMVEAALLKISERFVPFRDNRPAIRAALEAAEKARGWIQPSERDRKMATERRAVLAKVAPLLRRGIWEAVLSDVTDLVIAERQAAREEGMREPWPITDAMVANAAVALRPWFPTETPINQLAAARAALEAAERAR